MENKDQEIIISKILSCNSANDIKDLSFIEEMLVKRRTQLEEQFHVKVKKPWGFKIV